MSFITKFSQSIWETLKDISFLLKSVRGFYRNHLNIGELWLQKPKKTTKQIISQAGNFDLMLFIH